METIEFNLDKFYEIVNFVMDSAFSITGKVNCKNSDILICMPKYLLELLKYKHLESIATIYKDNEIEFFCGLKIQMSLDNNITVFYNAFHPSKIIKYIYNL